MSDQITSAAELDALPLGCAFTDNSGDVCMLFSKSPLSLTGPETSTLTADYVLKHFGPLTLRWRPDQPQRVQVGRKDLAVHIEQFLKTHTTPPGPISALEPGITVTPLQLADAVLALFPGRPEREVLAQGWDEGYAAGVIDYRRNKWFPTDKGAEARPDLRALTPNPYHTDESLAARGEQS